MMFSGTDRYDPCLKISATCDRILAGIHNFHEVY